MNFVPHQYQQYCMNRIVQDPAVGLFLDMGLGKTIITWQREAAKWDNVSHLRISAVLGSTSKRIRALHTPADVYIINRENVVWLVDYYKNDWPFDMVVADEMSSFKNHRAKRFKALAAIRSHITRLVGLTGTPSPNGLSDLWSQVYLLDQGERLGKYFTHFRERYFEPGRRCREVVYSYDPKEGAEKAIMDAISDICVSMKSEDYLELPEIVYHDVPVALSTKAQRDYNELEKKMVLDLGDNHILDVTSAAALSNKLQQLANGAVYTDSGAWQEIHHDKVEAFMELIEQLNGKHAIVFYNFRHDLDRLIAALQKTNLRVRQLQTSVDELDWNAGKVDVLLAHPASTAYGLNLQDGGNHAIWFGLNWSLELYQQANKRLHRQGQKNRVIVHQLICEGTRDEDLASALLMKDAAQQYVMDSLKARVDKYRRQQ